MGERSGVCCRVGKSGRVVTRRGVCHVLGVGGRRCLVVQVGRPDSTWPVVSVGVPGKPRLAYPAVVPGSYRVGLTLQWCRVAAG